jgi:hypothetical protein
MIIRWPAARCGLASGRFARAHTSGGCLLRLHLLRRLTCPDPTFSPAVHCAMPSMLHVAIPAKGAMPDRWRYKRVARDGRTKIMISTIIIASEAKRLATESPYLTDAITPTRSWRPIPPTSQRRSIAHRAAPGVSDAMRSRAPDRILACFARLLPWMHPRGTTIVAMLTLVNQGVHRKSVE